jgi:hypothetical protein
MECPNCGESTEVIGSTLTSIANLSVGVSVMWCPECGTTFRNSHLADQAQRVMIPKKTAPKPKPGKNVKLEKECFTCKTFDKEQRRQFKCAVQNSCPGLNWSEKRKQRAIEREAFSKLWGGKSK